MAIPSAQMPFLDAGGRVSREWFQFLATLDRRVLVGSGAPAMTAAQGTIYERTDGSSTSTRAYINTDGSTAWTAITTAT